MLNNWVSCQSKVEIHSWFPRSWSDIQFVWCQPRKTADLWVILDSGRNMRKLLRVMIVEGMVLHACCFFHKGIFKIKSCTKIQALRHHLLNGFVQFWPKNPFINLQPITMGNYISSSWFNHVNFTLTTLIAIIVLLFQILEGVCNHFS